MDTCTLEMPAEIKTNWLAALRSGKYAQGREALCTFDYDSYTDELDRENITGYCCLGVLMDVVDGRIDFAYADDDATLPLNSWYDRHGMSSFYKNVEGLNLTNSPSHKADGTRADSQLFHRNDGYSKYPEDYRPGFSGVAQLTHVAPSSFLEIADFIETNVKGV